MIAFGVMMVMMLMNVMANTAALRGTIDENEEKLLVALVLLKP